MMKSRFKMHLISVCLVLALLCLGCVHGAEQTETVDPSPVPQATQAAPVEDDVVIIPGETNAPIQAPDATVSAATEAPKPTEPPVDVPITDSPTATPTAAATTAQSTAKATPKPTSNTTPKPTATPRPTAAPTNPDVTPTPNSDIELPEIP